MAGKPIVNIGLDKNPDLPQSCLVAPMSVMGRVVGAVEVQSKMPSAYTKEHATAMRMAANLTANAIENVRLIQQEREREEQLRQAQKIESVGRLTGGIAHDFNNMLTAINGYSDLTLRHLSDDDPLRRNVEEIKKAGERSAALTQQLLAFSRQQVLQSKVIDLNEIINDTIQMLERLMGENIQLVTILDSKLGRVEGDPGQLTQVLMNLVVNARDAMPEGGFLTIKTSNKYLDEDFAARFPPTQPGSYIMLEVTDTGIGMDAETQKNIFEPFFTTKEVGKGTGLGLSTAYGIIKQSDGFIWVKSEIGRGTTFEIYLPRIDREVSAEIENNKLENTPKGMETILVVEDEDIVRALTRRILEESGYRVIEARNGVEALSNWEKQNVKIDLLMTDVLMPQMGGSELAEKLAKIYPDLCILFTSGYTDDAIIRHNVIDADNNFIQKPFTFDELTNKVREILDNKN
jgi:two-component system cell cycle sensor histidine kinase/response regulator CckA